MKQEVELNTLLRDILKHLHKGVVTDPVLASLESIVFKLLTHYTDLTHVLNLVSSMSHPAITCFNDWLCWFS